MNADSTADAGDYARGSIPGPRAWPTVTVAPAWARDHPANRCYHHGYEPLTEETYRVCLECGHAFEAQELLDAHNAIVAELRTANEYSPGPAPGFDDPARDDAPVETDPAAVRVCPLCTHDF